MQLEHIRKRITSALAWDLSLRKLALEIGISAATLSRIVRGSTPSFETYRKLDRWSEKR